MSKGFKVLNKESGKIIFSGTKKECQAFLQGISYTEDEVWEECFIEQDKANKFEKIVQYGVYNSETGKLVAPFSQRKDATSFLTQVSFETGVKHVIREIRQA